MEHKRDGFFQRGLKLCKAFLATPPQKSDRTMMEQAADLYSGKPPPSWKKPFPFDHGH